MHPIRFPLAMALALILVLGAGTALAASDIGFKGAGGRLGLVDTDAGSTVGFGGHLELGELAPRWALQGNLLYWKKSEDISAVGVPTVSWSYSLLSVEAVAKYMFENTSPKWKPYAGGGPGLHFASIDAGGFDDTDTKFGLTILGGTNYMLNESTDLFGEFRYLIVSDFDYWSLSAGVTFWFGQGGA